MLILSILAVVALPRISSTDAFSERAFHDALRSAFDYARKSAVAARRHTCVVVTPGMLGSGKAEFFIDAALLPETVGGSVDCGSNRLTLPGGTCAPGTLCPPAKVDLLTGGGVLTVVFSPLGQPENVTREPLASRQQITVGTLPLAIEPLTGLVH